MAKATAQQALFKVYKDYNTGKIDASKMLYTVKNVSGPSISDLLAGHWS